jgi:hypothetical protein
MTSELSRLLRKAPLSELGPISWRAADALDEALAEVERLRAEVSRLSPNGRTIPRVV